MSATIFEEEILNGMDKWKADHEDDLKEVKGLQELMDIFKNDKEMRDALVDSNSHNSVFGKIPNEAAINKDLETILEMAKQNNNDIQGLVDAYENNPEEVIKHITEALERDDPGALNLLINPAAAAPTATATPAATQPPVQATQQPSQTQPQPTTNTAQLQPSINDILGQIRAPAVSGLQSPIPDTNRPAMSPIGRRAITGTLKEAEPFDPKTKLMQEALVKAGFDVGKYKSDGVGHDGTKHKAGDPWTDGVEGSLTEGAAIKAGKAMGLSEEQVKNMPIEEFTQKVEKYAAEQKLQRDQANNTQTPVEDTNTAPTEENSPGFRAAMDNALTPEPTEMQQRQVEAATNTITPEGLNSLEQSTTAPQFQERETTAITPKFQLGETEIGETYAEAKALEDTAEWNGANFENMFKAAAGTDNLSGQSGQFNIASNTYQPEQTLEANIEHAFDGMKLT